MPAHLGVLLGEREVPGEFGGVLPGRGLRRVARLVQRLAHVQPASRCPARPPPTRAAAWRSRRRRSRCSSRAAGRCSRSSSSAPTCGCPRTGRRTSARPPACRSRAGRCAALRHTPKGLMPKLRAGPDRLDAGRGLAHQLVDVVAAPGGPVGEAAAVPVVGLVVVEGLAGHRIRVEVVVEVHGVDGVLLHRVEHRVLDEGADLGQPRVVVELPAVRHHPVRVPARGVGGDQLRRVGVVGDAVRVEPGVQFQAPARGPPRPPCPAGPSRGPCPGCR